MTDIASINFQSAATHAPATGNAERENGEAFSYTLAAASLERGAAKSLEAHGARPDRTAASEPARANDKPDAGNQTRARAQQAEKSISPDKPPSQSAAGDPEKPAKSATPQSGPAAPVAAGAAPAPTATQPTALQTKTAETAAIRETSAAKTKIAAMKTTRLADAPPAVKEAFAEVLARRFEKTSVFELRLDPPEIGRVEGRLAVNDDGKAILSLTFDNQAAFDLFSRDQQALRAALQQAGLEFAAGDFVFSFNEPPHAGGDAARFVVSDSPPPAAYDALFLSQWTAGAVDIRI